MAIVQIRSSLPQELFFPSLIIQENYSCTVKQSSSNIPKATISVTNNLVCQFQLQIFIQPATKRCALSSHPYHHYNNYHHQSNHTNSEIIPSNWLRTVPSNHCSGFSHHFCVALISRCQRSAVLNEVIKIPDSHLVF